MHVFWVLNFFLGSADNMELEPVSIVIIFNSVFTNVFKSGARHISIWRTNLNGIWKIIHSDEMKLFEYPFISFIIQVHDLLQFIKKIRCESHWKCSKIENPLISIGHSHIRFYSFPNWVFDEKTKQINDYTLWRKYTYSFFKLSVAAIRVLLKWKI